MPTEPDTEPQSQLDSLIQAPPFFFFPFRFSLQSALNQLRNWIFHPCVYVNQPSTALSEYSISSQGGSQNVFQQQMYSSQGKLSLA